MRLDFKIEESGGQKVIVVGGEVFDWGLEEVALDDANQFFSNRDIMRAVHSDVRAFFLACLEEQTGLRMSIREVNEALRRGYVEK